MTKTMAEVLVEHGEWRYTSGAGSPIECRKCGAPIETNIITHQAAALSAAGFGLVADAGAKALEDAAGLLKPPGTLWWGDVGVTVADPPGLPFATLDEWLRARAAAVRGDV